MATRPFAQFRLQDGSLSEINRLFDLVSKAFDRVVTMIPTTTGRHGLTTFSIPADVGTLGEGDYCAWQSTGTLKSIVTTNWGIGSRIAIKLVATGGNITVKNNLAGMSGAAILLRAGTDLTVTSGTEYLLDLIYGGRFWKQPD